MRHHLVNLYRNLAAGLRLVAFLPVSRLAFRIDLVQLLLLLVVSALLDVAVDWVRYGAEGYFSWFGLGNEFFGAGILLLSAAILALAFRQTALVLALPVLVLAGFPLLQILRVVPTIAPLETKSADFVWLVFDGAMIAWVFVLSARSVGIALAPARPGRLWRALAGGLVLIAPIWFASSIAPNDAWWKEPVAGFEADPRYPNPASEPVLAAQQHLIDDALAGLDDERPGATDLYFIGFAGDAREDVFRKDVLAAQKVMDERWGTSGRSLALINNPRTLLESPMATVTNLREALNEIGGAIDADQDVVMVYLVSHGSKQHVLDVSMPPLELAPLTASALRSLLDASGIKWRIVVVSACYSGGFIDALKDDYTLVLTASAADRTSFGCGQRSDSTFFGEALFQQGLAQSESLLGAFEAAKELVAERERAGGFRPPSNPQIYVGPAMAEKLKELDRGNAALRTGRSV
ncbi:MAG: C13 family peptidase [Betaproteobacteria bacterium]